MTATSSKATPSYPHWTVKVKLPRNLKNAQSALTKHFGSIAKVCVLFVVRCTVGHVIMEYVSAQVTKVVINKRGNVAYVRFHNEAGARKAFGQGRKLGSHKLFLTLLAPSGGDSSETQDKPQDEKWLRGGLFDKVVCCKSNGVS